MPSDPMLVAELDLGQVEAVATALAGEFFVDAGMIRDAVLVTGSETRHRTANGATSSVSSGSRLRLWTRSISTRWAPLLDVSAQLDRARRGRFASD